MSTNQSKSISLEDLIALNDEIAAMVRAGVPLDQGLLATGSDMPGRLGTLTTTVAVELSRGTPLVEAIEKKAESVPTAYRAVIAAGLRCGRLAAAAESVSGFLRRLAQSRRDISASLIYPVLVVLLAWLVGYFLFTCIIPGIYWALADATMGKSWVTQWLPAFGKAWGWLGAIPIALAVFAFWIWYRSGRATIAQAGGSTVFVEWMPWIGRMVRMSRIATFTDVLAMLVENNVPLDQGLPLAAATTGDLCMIRSAETLAERLRGGDPPDRESFRRLAIPPLLTWMIASGLRHERLQSSLRHAAATYRRRAQHSAEMARIFFPVTFTLVVGGLAVAISALGLFIPYVSMLHELTKVW